MDTIKILTEAIEKQKDKMKLAKPLFKIKIKQVKHLERVAEFPLRAENVEEAKKVAISLVTFEQLPHEWKELNKTDRVTVQSVEQMEE